MNYLENSLCKFTPLFKINYKIKKNLISCSFFKMYNKGYKDFNLYINGLKKLYNYVNKINNYTIRLFIDNTIFKDKELMIKIKKMNKIELVLYECKNLLLEGTDYHEGLFGTLVRFFPIFDFPNNDGKNIVLSDIDDIAIVNNIKELDIIYKNNKVKDIYILKKGNIGKNILFNYNPYKNILTPYSITCHLISFLRINNKVIIDFINMVNDNTNVNEKYSYYYDIMKDLKNLNNKKYNSKFIFGVDEYFINKTLTEYLIDNRLPIAINFKFEITSIIYYILQYYSHINKIKIKLLDKILNKILKNIKLENKHLSILEKYEIIDKIIYSNNELSLKINEFVYKEFIKYYSRDEYNFLFPNYLYDILLSKKMLGIYKYHIISFNDINYDDIVINKKTLDDKTIKKLDTLKIKYIK